MGIEFGDIGKVERQESFPSSEVVESRYITVCGQEVDGMKSSWYLSRFHTTIRVTAPILFGNV